VIYLSLKFANQPLWKMILPHHHDVPFSPMTSLTLDELFGAGPMARFYDKNMNFNVS